MWVDRNGTVTIVETAGGAAAPWIAVPAVIAVAALVEEPSLHVLLFGLLTVVCGFGLYRLLAHRRVVVRIDQTERELTVTSHDGLAEHARTIAFSAIAGLETEKRHTVTGIVCVVPVLVLRNRERIDLALPTCRPELIRPAFVGLRAHVGAVETAGRRAGTDRLAVAA